MSALKKAKGFRNSKPGLYLSIGSSLAGGVGIIRRAKKARSEGDTLQLLDAIVSAAAIATGVALLARELRRMSDAGETDVLAD